MNCFGQRSASTCFGNSAIEEGRLAFSYGARETGGVERVFILAEAADGLRVSEICRISSSSEAEAAASSSFPVPLLPLSALP